MTEKELQKLEAWLEEDAGPHGDLSAHAAVNVRALIDEVRRLRGSEPAVVTIRNDQALDGMMGRPGPQFTDVERQQLGIMNQGPPEHPRRRQ